MHIFIGFNDPALFRLDRNRIALAERNGLVRLAVIETLGQGVEYLEHRVSWFKNMVGYGDLGKKDRDVVRRSGTTIRDIVRGWGDLDVRSRKEFLDGALLPSTAVRRIKQECAKRG